MPVWHHLLSVLSTLAIGPVCGHATPLALRWDEKSVKHSWNAVPEFWECLGHPPSDITIDLYLALKPQHENALIDTLQEVSNPRHAKYGAYLSKEQVAKLVAPHPDTLNLVNFWLDDHGIPPSSVSTTLGGNWLIVTGVSMPQANDILGASYQLYQHVETNDTVIRTVSYSLPVILHGHIQTVSPTTYFGSSHTQRNKPRIHPHGTAAAREKAGSVELVSVLPSREAPVFVTPAYLRSLYKTMGYVPAAVDQNAIGTAGFVKEYPSPQDLRTFMTEFRTDGEDATFSVVKVNDGRYDPSDPGMEANLDLQIAEAMTYPTPNIFFSTGGMPGTTTDPYLNWLRHLLGQTKVPQAISVSYSSNEYDFPPALAGRLCDLFALLGVRGVSVLFASGDWGVGGNGCLVKGTGNVARFLPQFPASCPWVTAVGGTTRDGPEVAASLSGGGFSNFFPRPFYQAKAVPSFLPYIGDINKGLYNPNGRGIPDIAAQALNLVMVQKGRVLRRHGTSGSAPTVAGIVSLLNDYLISQGDPPLGFLNPWLYSEGLAGLNDITSGSNPGCGTDGFPAIIGWDPVTGLGTPDFSKLEEIIDEREQKLHNLHTITS